MASLLPLIYNIVLLEFPTLIHSLTHLLTHSHNTPVTAAKDIMRNKLDNLCINCPAELT
jgi:hypothetical protein